VTEAEWAVSDDATLMLRALDTLNPVTFPPHRSYPYFNHPQGMREFLRKRKYDRKLRLFAVACCRPLWHLLGEQGRGLVEAAERYADRVGRTSELIDRVQATFGEAGLDPVPAGARTRADRRARSRALARALAAEAARAAGGYSGFSAALGVLRPAAVAAKRDFRPPAVRGRLVTAERRAQASLLRDTVGNPFRPPPACPPEMTSVAARLAAAIYEGRRFGELPLLADALEDAGCTDADLLGHLRGPGPHVRGCWAVDLLLAKR
jgi:hypothetical protein